MAEVLRVIQPVTHQELIRRIETNEPRIVLQPFRDALVQQRTDLERPRLPLLQCRHQTIQCAARINDVLDQNYVLPLELRFRIVNQVNRPARNRSVTITGSHEKIDLKWTSDLPHEIA